MKMYSSIKVVLILLGCFCATLGFAANTISGKVRNQTTNRPAAGDEVILLRLGEGMEEAARTHTDAQGAFSLPVAVSGAQHIVRVLHQGVNYDQRVSGAAPLEIPVFDAAPKIPGLSGSLGIVHLQSDSERLTITEMYSITNASSPPVTQVGPNNFVFFTPGNATLDSFEVKKEGGVWVNGAPVPIRGQPGRYAVDFPLRPGETLFKYAYHMPYDGAATLHLKLAYPIKSFAVLHPPSMIFKASRPQAFTSPGLIQGLRLEQAVSQPVVREVPAFEISGIGTAAASAKPETQPLLPPQSGSSSSSPLSSSSPSSMPTPTKAADNAGVQPASTQEDSSRGVWAIGAALAAVFAAGVFAIWRKRRPPVAAAPAAASGDSSVLVDALKEELFQLESERLHGAISAEQYQSAKQSLNLSIQRATARSKSPVAAGKP